MMILMYKIKLDDKPETTEKKETYRNDLLQDLSRQTYDRMTQSGRLRSKQMKERKDNLNLNLVYHPFMNFKRN